MFGDDKATNHYTEILEENIEENLRKRIFGDGTEIMHKSDFLYDKSIVWQSMGEQVGSGAFLENAQPRDLIGDFSCLLNSLNLNQVNVEGENILTLTNCYSHEASIVLSPTESDIIYVTYNKNENGGDVSPITDSNLYVEISCINITNMEIVSQHKIAGVGDICGDLTITSGCGIPNSVLIDDEIIRVIFTAKTSDGDVGEFSADFDIATKTVTNIQRNTITIEGVAYPFTLPTIRDYVYSGVTNMNCFISMNSSFAKYNDIYYIGCGVDYYTKGAIIFKTTDFVNYEVYKIDEHDEFNMQYECACGVDITPSGTPLLICISRSSGAGKQKVSRYNLNTGANHGLVYYVDANDSKVGIFNRTDSKDLRNGAYMIASRNNRNRTDIIRIGFNNSIGETLAQMWSWEYPCVVEKDDYFILAGTEKHKKVRVRKIKPFEFTMAKTIQFGQKLIEILS